ncbi:hypothetical protein Hanom_Chr16g01480881 [Helianthus anomalus]
MAHCNIPSSDGKPPSSSSWSFNDSSVSVFPTSPAPLADDHNKPPEAELLTGSAVENPNAVTTTTNANAKVNSLRPIGRSNGCGGFVPLSVSVV